MSDNLDSNPLVLKVHGGTRSEGGSPLCETCHFSIILRGPARSEEAIFCSVIGSNNGMQRVPMKVIQCNRYSDKRQPSLYEMREMAWELRTTGNRIGFVSPKDRERERQPSQVPPAGFQ